MPSRSLLRAVLATAGVTLGLLAAAGGVAAKVVVVDRAGHVLATPLGDDRDDALLAWTAAGLVVRAPGDQALLVDPHTGARTPLGPRPGITSLGPDGSWVALTAIPHDPDGFAAILHAPDGRTFPPVRVALSLLDDLHETGTVAWSADGRRVAVGVDEEAAVLDVATGALVRRVPADELTAQALSPDGSALATTVNLVVRRIDLAGGADTTLLAPARFDGVPVAFWSPSGRLALLSGSGARLTSPDATVALHDVSVLGWTPDGTALAAERDEAGRMVDGCYVPRSRVDLYAPAAPRTPLLPVTSGQVRGLRWSPDGTRAAIDLGALVDPALEVRGRRHAWPLHLPKDYEMETVRGDRAVRRALARFAADLRGGTGRQAALTRLRRALDATWAERWGRPMEITQDSPTFDRVTRAVNAWLRAAGFRPVQDAFDLGCPRVS